MHIRTDIETNGGVEDSDSDSSSETGTGEDPDGDTHSYDADVDDALTPRASAAAAAAMDGRDVDDKAGIWPLLLRTLGAPYAGMANIPFWLDTSVVDSCDWGK